MRLRLAGARIGALDFSDEEQMFTSSEELMDQWLLKCS